MKLYEGLFKAFEREHKIIKTFDKMIEPTNRLKKSFELDKIKLPKFEFPKFDFPEIDFPDIEVDYERIEKLAKNNSSHGWTLTGEVDIHFYLDEQLLDNERECIDKKFVEYFESNSKERYFVMINAIQESIDEKWKSVINDCFEFYETKKFRVVIPMLITIIEGEISKIAESNKVGFKLLQDWEKQIPNKEERFMLIVSYTLYEYLLSNTFESKKFAEERGTILNRNWVLHGRDDPSLWTRTDALKLINVISTIQFIQS